MYFYQYNRKKDINGNDFYEKKRVRDPIKLVQGDKEVRRFLELQDKKLAVLKALAEEEKKNKNIAEAQTKAAMEVKDGATKLQEILKNPDIRQEMEASGGGGVEEAIDDMQSVVDSVTNKTPTVLESIEIYKGLNELARSVSNSSSESYETASRWSDSTQSEEDEEEEDFVRRSSSSRISDLTQDSSTDNSSGNGDGDGNVLNMREEDKVVRQPSGSSGRRSEFSSERSGVTAPISARTASQGNDSLNSDNLQSIPSYNTADTSLSEEKLSIDGGKRKTRRRSSKKNRKSKKVGGKKTKPKRKTKGKKIPFKKLLKKTRAKK